MTIQLNYFYRDASNFKNFGCVILSTSYEVLKEIDLKIRQRLIDGEYFDAAKVGVPEMFFDVSSEDDHRWHEYHSVEETNQESAVLRLEDFLDRL